MIGAVVSEGDAEQFLDLSSLIPRANAGIARRRRVVSSRKVTDLGTGTSAWGIAGAWGCTSCSIRRAWL